MDLYDIWCVASLCPIDGHVGLASAAGACRLMVRVPEVAGAMDRA